MSRSHLERPLSGSRSVEPGWAGDYHERGRRIHGKIGAGEIAATDSRKLQKRCNTYKMTTPCAPGTLPWRLTSYRAQFLSSNANRGLHPDL